VTADDFVTTAPTNITDAAFIGLLVGGATPASMRDVEIELYHVFPVDSVNPPDGRVINRANSPSDNNFAAADGALGQLSFTTTVLNATFHAFNSVLNGINPLPNQFTGGEGPVTGQEVQFNVHFNTPFSLNAHDHIFFRGGRFYLFHYFRKGGPRVRTIRLTAPDDVGTASPPVAA
jgi:hypothetical protein